MERCTDLSFPSLVTQSDLDEMCCAYSGGRKLEGCRKLEGYRKLEGCRKLEGKWGWPDQTADHWPKVSITGRKRDNGSHIRIVPVRFNDLQEIGDKIAEMHFGPQKHRVYAPCDETPESSSSRSKIFHFPANWLVANSPRHHTQKY